MEHLRQLAEQKARDMAQEYIGGDKRREGGEGGETASNVVGSGEAAAVGGDLQPGAAGVHEGMMDQVMSMFQAKEGRQVEHPHDIPQLEALAEKVVGSGMQQKMLVAMVRQRMGI